jgi:glycosyltransferase involved in cell wall biosynthesis
MYRLYPEVNLISISEAQRAPIRYAHWVGTAYNGIPMEDFTLQARPGDYLAFLGRIAPEKRVDIAIEIAKRTGINLKIAAKVDKVDREYYEAVIKPRLNHPLVEFIGEIDQKAKDQFLGEAYAFLFPIDWPEPFGLAMAEAMACGTPVIAARAGSVPEVIIDERTGFICDSVDEMVRAVDRIGQIDRSFCREHVDRNFSVTTMVDSYERIYARVLAGHLSARRLAIDGGNGVDDRVPIKIRPARRP